jgi:hypothetical protein
MQLRQKILFACSCALTLLIAAIPVLLGIGALRLDPAPIPVALWWAIGILCVVTIVAAVWALR